MKRLEHNLPDLQLLVVAYIIMAFGISMVYSSSINLSQRMYHDQYQIFRSQLLWLGIGTIFLLAGLNINSRLMSRLSRILIVVNIALLVIVLIPGLGKKVAGSRSWIRIGSYGFQPSEFIKVSLVLYLASMFNRKKMNVESFFEGYLPPLIVCTIVIFLILLEPDFGTAMVISMIIGLLFFISGLKVRYIFATFFCLLPLAYLLISRVGYRKMRLLTFLNPGLDPINKGYHIIQSMKCFKLGGFFGVGFGKSIQKLWYLPQAHTDFIFSVIGEEVGFFGIFVLLGLFLYFFVRAIKICFQLNDKFSFLTASGIIIMWLIQFFINIFVSLGLMPVTGLPLPFISYGGSALVMNMTALGIILSLSKEIHQTENDQIVNMGPAI